MVYINHTHTQYCTSMLFFFLRCESVLKAYIINEKTIKQPPPMDSLLLE